MTSTKSVLLDLTRIFGFCIFVHNAFADVVTLDQDPFTLEQYLTFLSQPTDLNGLGLDPATQFTTIPANKQENQESTFNIPFGITPGARFRIRGGGALVLCEPGEEFKITPGRGGNCNSNDAGGISDVLLFPGGKQQLEYVSDNSDGTFTVPLPDGMPCPNGKFPDGLSCTFTTWTNPIFAEYVPKLGHPPFVAFVAEGSYFNEVKEIRPGLPLTEAQKSGILVDNNGVPRTDVAVYVRSTENFTRAFIVYSTDIPSEIVPEPSPIVLLTAGVPVVLFYRLFLWRRRKRKVC
jgi:hypothetical protein